MTCGIDDEDRDPFRYDGLFPIPFHPAEKLQGRTIQKLDSSQNRLHLLQMCSRISKDPSPQLIGSKGVPSLKGRHIEQINASSSLQGISIPALPREIVDSSFYQKDILDLTCEDFTCEDEKMESNWSFAQSPRYIEPPHREGLSLEERLSQNGLVFDCHRGQFIACRSWLKKVGHSIEKNLRKGAKKTCKFVKEHKTEILIAAGALIVGGCITAGVYYLVGTELAKDTATATIIATLAPFKDPPRKRRREVLASSEGPDPEKDLPSSIYIPPLRIHEKMSGKQVFDALTAPTPSSLPHLGLYPSSHPVDHLAASTPKTSIATTTPQILDTLFQPVFIPHPHGGIYPLDPRHRSKIEQSVAASRQSPPSMPFKSEFGAHLDHLYSRTISTPQESTPIGYPHMQSTWIETLRNDLNGIKNKILNHADVQEITSAITPFKQTLDTFSDRHPEKVLGHPGTDHHPLMHFLNALGRDCHTSTVNALPFGRECDVSSLPIEKSRSYTIDGIDSENMLITFVNGMNNPYALAQSNAKHIQSLCPNPMSIHGVYNSTNGPLLDLAEIGLLNYPGYSPVTQDLLREKWTAFHEKNKNNPHAKILHFCHSQGAAHTKNALMGLSEKIRARVITVAIAPAEVVPRELCYDSFNFASKKDLVPYGEILHASFRADHLNEEERTTLFQTVAANQSQLIWLEPHETSGLLDLEHAFQSPIFIEVIIEHIKNYFSKSGEYQ